MSKMTTIRKLMFLFLLFVFVPPALHADELRLLDGRLVFGRLNAVADNQIYLRGQSENLTVSLSDIGYLVTGNDYDGYSRVNIRLKNGQTCSGELVLLCRDILLYKTRQNIDIVTPVYLYDIAAIHILDAENVIPDTYERLVLNDVSDIMRATSRLAAGYSEADEPEDDPENVGFYDKYWLRFNGHISRTTGNMLWSLIDLYADKEKNLTLIYNEKLNGEKQKSEVRISEISRQLRASIIALRYEFAYRAYMLIVRQQPRLSPSQNEPAE